MRLRNPTGKVQRSSVTTGGDCQQFFSAARLNYVDMSAV